MFDRGTLEHISQITPELLVTTKDDPTQMVEIASSCGSKGSGAIGINLMGKYCVKSKGIVTEFETPEEAIMAYKNLFLYV